jgi:hypothetical protein
VRSVKCSQAMLRLPAMYLFKLARAFAIGVCWASVSFTQTGLAAPVLKSYQERASLYAHSDLALRSQPSNTEKFVRCLGDWDPSTHMTKNEWRRSCERSVVYDPDAFR